MANSENYQIITLPANADLSSNSQYRFVTLTNSSGTARVARAGDGANAIGVLYNNPAAANRAASVAISGVVKVKAGGTITAGNMVSSNADGDAVVAGTGDYVLGMALVSAVDNDVFEVLLRTPVRI